LNVPIVRSHERMEYKRCQRRWHWKWRRGLVPRAKAFGALELGTWMHEALAKWYVPGSKRSGPLADHFHAIAYGNIRQAADATVPDQEIDKARELANLGYEMAKAYEAHYGKDHNVIVIKAELPLDFTFANDEGVIIAKHVLKPDLVYTDRNTGDVWLMEHKTAKSIHTSHLPLDDQARPYVAMSELALRKIGAIRKEQVFRGIMYNFLRKAMPDDRPTNELGEALNRDGSVSKRQPPQQFLRHPVTLTRAAKRKTLIRLRAETLTIARTTQDIRHGRVKPEDLPKTPHSSCDRFCPYFDMCVMEENGLNIAAMQMSSFSRQNPYDYGQTTDEPSGFEIG
jgi:PD-(D/E)XK nuclease superfamily